MTNLASAGSGPVFEDLAVGACIPDLVRGPIREPHLMRWSAAIENWHRIHYDLRFATEHDGLPGLLVNGSWKQHFLVQAITRWAYPTGWLASIEFRFRAMDVVGSELTAWGIIRSLTRADPYGKVGLEIGIRNQAGVESTPGSATVVVPVAGGPAVPYPLPRT